ncbi:hypothetical protein K435DRAFT_879076 [Dendrothele bispora CBS 962.96]|uniref:F-box domain-containing protein n=1 Tax=Dendrothele bispora (strain CBS 962.96) TaxID=1314807 RepID=A0A4S8KLY4_DENBC|nr:hypothetical protein K435DRAFT_879076 [Dendrothele bispora CBS 962.96]
MWSRLLPELKLDILDVLPLDAVKALASVDHATYSICLPVIFRNIHLHDYRHLQRFYQNVPSKFGIHIYRLDLCTKDEDDSETIETKTKTVTALLTSCIRLKALTLRLEGSLHNSLIPCFQNLTDIMHLTIINRSQETKRPLSERFVVSVCASLRSLEHISLERITRSQLHASELHDQNHSIPLVRNDDTIPDHPVLGSALSLPSLLSIPTLKSLCIRDTHLGDPLWATFPVGCQLQNLVLGAYSGCDEDFDSECTAIIMAALSRTSSSSLVSLSLASSLCSVISTPPATFPSTPVTVTVGEPPQMVPEYHLPSLRKLYLLPSFPVDSIVHTMIRLASSPIGDVEVQCYKDDVVAVCESLEKFIALLPIGRNLAINSSAIWGFFGDLERIDLVAVRDPDSGPHLENDEEESNRAKAIQQLKGTCKEAKLLSSVSYVLERGCRVGVQVFGSEGICAA